MGLDWVYKKKINFSIEFMCTQFDLQFIVSLSAFWNIGIGFTTVKVTNKGFTLPEVEERKDAWFFS